MQFCELSKEEFRKFLEKHPLQSFLQTPEIGELRKKSGWTVDFVGVKKKSKIIGATMLVGQKNFMNSYEFYTSRGPLLDYDNTELVSFFFQNLIQYVQKKNGYILRIDPYLIYHQRDIDGNIVEHGVNHENVVQQLKSIGFKRKESTEQVRYMFSIDLGKSNQEIFQSFRSNVRNYIRKTEKIGIVVRELTKSELPALKKIIDDTGKRKGFASKSLTYYENMYDLFHGRGEIRYLIASIYLDDYLDKLKNELKEYEKKLEETEDVHSKQGVRKSLIINIENTKKRMKETEELIEKKGTQLDLSAAMFMMTGHEVIYLFSGNYDEYMKFNAQYAIQWNMIQYANDHGFDKYNFYGISGNFDENDSEYGVYEFKRGFSGYVEELIGEFQIPIDTKKYMIFNILNNTKKFIKRCIGRE